MSLPFPETIVFDLDGTLVDTAPDLAAALNAALTGRGRPGIAMADVRALVGRGARKLIQQVLERSGPAEPEEIDLVMAHFLAHYEANIANASRPFEKAEMTVRAIAARGHKIGICTNKPVVLSRKLMDALALSDLFPVILGADSRPYRKPDPRHLLDTIAELGGQRDSAVLIGDSDVDVRTARAANVPVIAVSFGYSEIAARDLGADAVIDHFDQLEEAISVTRGVLDLTQGRPL